MTTSPVPEQSTRPNRPSLLILLAMLVVIGVGAAITATIVTRDDGPPSAGSTAQLTQVQASCRDWMTSSPADSQSDDQWCTDMFAWMSDQSGGSMMGSMMWQGPEQMDKACREWVSDDRVDTGAWGQQRCNDMVEWMDGHMSSRGGNWMMQDR